MFRNYKMLLGCYRSNEVDEIHAVTRLVRDLGATQESEGFSMTEVSVGNLEPSQVQQLLRGLLSTNDEGIASLAQICHKKVRSKRTELHLQYKKK